MAKILVVDDESGARRVMQEFLLEDGHDVALAGGFLSAREHIASASYDLVLTDQRMPDGDGLDVLSLVSDMLPNTPTILVTSNASIDLAVRAMREGAFDFITKPLEPDVLRLTVARAVRMHALKSENQILRRALSGIDGEVVRMVGNSPPMRALHDIIARVAPTNATVFIEGETGSGKELVARQIHNKSCRRNQPFVPVNCAAIPESLLESQLFGHERGAFTGANTAHQGLFEVAHGGTIFLDEIGELPFDLQAKLLRILVDGEILRVGAQKTRRVDVRIISATHRNIERLRQDGGFRDDLYYRISVLPVHVPPLRERREDIALLANHFLQHCRVSLNRPDLILDPSALAALEAYAFPGNVRELHNLVERACILGRESTLTSADFPLAILPDQCETNAEVAVPHGDIKLRDFLDRVELELLERALRFAGGNQAEAGRRLGLSRSDMNYRLKKFGLNGSPKVESSAN